jgi:hypothetical protein
MAFTTIVTGRARMGAKGLVGFAIAAVMTMSATALAVPAGPGPQGPVLPLGAPPVAWPPAAWLETQGGDFWLQTGEFLWCSPLAASLGPRLPAGTVLCTTPPHGDPPAGPNCRSGLTGPPEIRLLPGEVARLHLAFAPTSLVLALGHSVSALAPLADAELPPATETGGAILAAAGPWGSRVRYLARIVVASDATPPSVSAIRARRDGSRVRLQIRLSEPASVQGCVEPVLSRGEFVGPRTLPLFRTLRGDSTAGGQVEIGLGRIPARRYRVYLRARDRDGNTTLTSQVITVPSQGRRTRHKRGYQAFSGSNAGR